MFTDEDSEELSFVTIYGGFKREPTTNISYSKIAKSELRRYDRRCARIDKLLYTYKRLEYSKVASAINMQLRKKKSTDLVTVTEILNKDFIDQLVNADDAYKFLSGIRNSPAHWEKEKKNNMAMVRQFNSATIFLTLSAAETKWVELLSILSEVVDGKKITHQEAETLEFKEKSRLIRQDPVTCARYFDHRFKQMLKLMTRENGIFDEHPVIRYYYRIEFQHRGSPHAHCTLWLKNAPIFDKDSPESFIEIPAFIDKFITCTSSLESVQNYISYQRHSHTQSCKRTFKGKVYCRFHYPMPPMRTTSVLLPLPTEDNDEQVKNNYDKIQFYLNSNAIKPDVSFDDFLKLPEIALSEFDYIQALRSHIKKTTIYIKRPLSAIYTNPFNERILSLHRANMDIQFILDPYACIGYIVDYINKSDRGMSHLLKEASKEADEGNFDVKKKLRHIANKFSNATEISAQECVYFILGMELSKSSHDCIFINTNRPETRDRFIKDRSDLLELQKQIQIQQINIKMD